MGTNDLEERLICFAVRVIKIAESVQKTYAGLHLSGQLIKASSSAALNYGEAQSAESRKDFIHKMKVVLKELRESNVNLKIIYRLKIYKDEAEMQWALQEVHELISICVTSINTASKNQLESRITK